MCLVLVHRIPAIPFKSKGPFERHPRALYVVWHFNPLNISSVETGRRSHLTGSRCSHASWASWSSEIHELSTSGGEAFSGPPRIDFSRPINSLCPTGPRAGAGPVLFLPGWNWCHCHQLNQLPGRKSGRKVAMNESEEGTFPARNVTGRTQHCSWRDGYGQDCLKIRFK